MDRLFIISLLLFSTLFTSCGEEPRRATYYPTERDTLDFLVRHSDVIAVVAIVDGLPEDYGGLRHKRPVEHARARIDELLRGEIPEESFITIAGSPIHNAPGAVQTLLYLRNGEYIAFLKKRNEIYKPLTPYSLIEIYFGKGHPVWKQTDSKYVDIPDTSKDEILQEIRDAIEPIAAVGPIRLAPLAQGR